MANHGSAGKGEPTLRKTVFEDLHRGDFFSTIRRDFTELKDFFLDEDRQSRLKDMGRVKRWLYMTAWLLKSLFLKLTPARRILLVVGVLLLLVSPGSNDSNNINIIAGLILLFILMLELKDKLVARDELESGRAVQNALMPEKSPVVPGWELWLFTRPANEVGGDLVDYLQITETRFGVALGDVAGKGLGAALLMAKLQATLRALVPDYSSLGDLGVKINEIFYRDGLPKSFASLIYLELKPDSGFVRILNAGHMPPIALKGAEIEQMPKGAPALGLKPETVYAEQQFELQNEDLLLVYSDGLTEARNEQGDFFGDQRLLQMLPKLQGLSAEKSGERLLAEVKRFVGEFRANDDLSLIVLKRQSESAEHQINPS
ncbi:MAG: PP2C family protein-serine/threonine phosphatase [bacterium]